MTAQAPARPIKGYCTACQQETPFVRSGDAAQCQDCGEVVILDDIPNDSEWCECGNRKPETAEYCRACAVADEREE